MLTFVPEFYKTLMESLDNSSVLLKLDESGHYIPIRCSREFAAMMEYTPEEFIEAERKEARSTIYPPDRGEVEYLFNNRIARDGKNHVTIRKISGTGRIIWMHMNYAFFDFDGDSYVYCNYFDVSEIKENEARLEVLYHNMKGELDNLTKDSLGTFRINITADLIEERVGSDLYESDIATDVYSESYRARSSYYPIERERERFIKCFAPANLVRSYYEGNATISDTFFTRRKSGKACFTRLTASLTKHPTTGDIIAFITEQDCNGEKVNETMSGKILAEQYDMITYLVDDSYGVVIGNADLIQKGSIFPNEMHGSYRKYIEEQVMVVAEGSDEEKNALRDALSLERIEDELNRREPYVVNVTCRIDGELFYKCFTFYAVDLEARFYIILKSDTTELQREQMLRNEQLKNALYEAKQANVAKTAFLSRMSHEIRTPMNAIIGLDTIALQETELPEKTRAYLEKIGSSARYLLSLINDILDMSRIESGKMIFKNEEFSFKDFLEQINTMIAGQCHEKGLHYDCFVHGKVDEYYIGDAMKLKQVLINILGNAAKFTDKGGTIGFHVEKTNSAGNVSTLKFTVEDTGIGMEEGYLSRIFEPFSQEDSTNTNRYGGSGLGLAISKNIIAMMNGTISVTSEKGKGSRFVVAVPMKKAEDQSLSWSYENKIDPRSMRILVIDDDATACLHAKIVLEEAGFSSETCMTKDEALRLVKVHHARREDFDLILVDLRMPVHDGIDVTRAIREAVGSDTTIIILTAYSWDDVEEEAVAAGVDGFMRKPLFSEAVITEFNEAYRRKSMKNAPKTMRGDFSGRRILVAEDIEINAQIIKMLLEMKDARVEIVENGREALDAFEGSETGYYSAIIMDVRMPVMDGLAAARAIRASGREDAKSIPIIAMTANAFDEDVYRSLQAGMDAHLSKPVDPKLLYETLDSFLTKGREKNNAG